MEAFAGDDAPPSGPNGDCDLQSGSLEDRLRAVLPARVLISVLLGREMSRQPTALPLSPVDVARKDRGPAAASPKNKRPRSWVNPVIFRVNIGAETKAEPGWLLPLICRRGGVTRTEVGAIRIGPRSSPFEIAAEVAADFARAARQPDPRDPQVMIVPVHAEGPRPDRRPHARGPGPTRPTVPEGGRPPGPRAGSSPRPTSVG